MKLGVVIVTYNRIELLKKCIEHAVGQTYPFSKIVVVNNNSNDGTYEYLNSHMNSEIVPIHLAENLGGSGGFSKGIEYCLGLDLDWVLLIDDDAIIDFTYNSMIVESISHHRETLAFSGTVMTSGQISLVHRRRQRGQTIMQRPVGKDEYLKSEFIYDIGTFCGLFVSMPLVSTIGLPESGYFIYYDDTEYSLRIRKYTSIVNVNEAIIDHRCNSSHSNNYDLWRRYYSIRNQLLMCRKHFPKWQQLLCDLKNMARMMWHVIKFIFGDKKYEKDVIKTIIIASRDGHNDIMGKNEAYSI